MEDKIVQGIHLTLQFLNGIPDSFWYQLGAFVVSVPFILAGVEIWKRHKRRLDVTKIELKKAINRAMGVITTAITIATYIVMGTKTNPEFLAIYPPALVGAATWVYNHRYNKLWTAAKTLVARLNKQPGEAATTLPDLTGVTEPVENHTNIALTPVQQPSPEAVQNAHDLL